MPLTKPTPPTPPTIDKGEATESTPIIDAHQLFNIPFQRETEIEETPAEKNSMPPPQSVERKVTTPEDMARDAVANGSGPLVKRTITRPENEPNERQNVPALTEKQKRGKDILREFQQEDRELQQMQTSIEKPRNFNNNQSESYSGIYWAVMLVLVAVLSVIFVRKVLVKKNPPLKKSDLFEDSTERLKSVSEKVVTKKPPPKNDDDKGKHFEVRI